MTPTSPADEYGPWVSYHVCSHCKTELSFYTVGHSGGTCPHCGFTTKGTGCSTIQRSKRWHRIKPLRWYEKLLGLRGYGQWEDKELTEQTQMLSTAAPPESPFEQALAMMHAERVRQVSAEGYLIAHDDSHIHGEIGQAAMVYYLCVTRPSFLMRHIAREKVQIRWPWPDGSFKPWKDGSSHFPVLDRRRCLVKAAALIEAEKSRLERLQIHTLKALATMIEQGDD